MVVRLKNEGPGILFSIARARVVNKLKRVNEPAGQTVWSDILELTETTE